MSNTAELRAGLVEAGARPLLHDAKGNTRTGRELADRIDRLAGNLAARCSGGPRVGLWYTNSLSAIEAFLAVEWLGGTRIPVDPNSSAGEARAVFEAADVDFVLGDASHAELLGGSALVHDDDEPLAADPRMPVEADKDAVHMIYPRSVIGGELFGIPLTYRNWHAIMATNIALYRSGRYGRWVEDSEVFLTAQHIMHGTGFLGTFPFLAMGLPQVIVEKFDIDTVLDMAERYAVTATMFVPPMLRSLIEAERDIGPAMRSMRHLLYGGGPVTGPEILSAFDRLGPVMTQVYGRVEGGWPLSILSTDDHALLPKHPEWLASCGRLIDEVEGDLLGAETSSGGELAVRSDMTSPEYTDPGGWCSLGDIMRRDDKGYLYFEGRRDRMINTGYHVYPDEIEAALMDIPGIGAALVVGEPHPRFGEQLVAYVVANGDRPHGSELESVMRDHLAERLARYKIPREFRVVKELPAA